ncbi:MAG TPA: UDP-N-acetylglucosamine 2-epimerase (non-hydrolyzing), partial [Desulfocapsa sulfexigens]|nr:UDP-N-acetylglucosamine 2-epimerase (non-hydrolyzing) [Desulfocapsa sulfexigens]
MLRIMSIAGARPNFMKLASIVRAVEQHNNASSEPGIKHIIVHTGQHYDQKMSDSFFIDLGIPNPDINLEVGSGSHASQTAEIMKRFEPVLLEECPDILLVVGDVNSTIACTLVAAKIEYPSNHKRRRPIIVHVEAGLRSFDRDMPEEVNRI